MRYLYLAGSCFLLMSLRKNLRVSLFSELMIEQRAVLILIGALVLFNNPVYGLMFVTSSRIPGVLELLFTLGFLATWIVCLLMVIDSLKFDSHVELSSVFGWKARMVPILFLVVFAVAVPSKMNDDSPIQWNILTDLGNSPLSMYILIFLILFSLWSLVHSYRATSQIASRRNMKRMSFFVGMAAVQALFLTFIVLFELASNSTTPAILSSKGLFTIHCAFLGYIYRGISVKDEVSILQELDMQDEVFISSPTEPEDS